MNWKFSLYPLAFILFLTGCATRKPAEVMWPLPPDEPRIKFVKSISSAEDVEKKSILKSAANLISGTSGSGLRLAKPYAVHVDRDGRIFVTDSAWASILMFDVKNDKFTLIGTEGPGVLAKPMGVTTDSTGRIFATDTVQNRAVAYDHDGNFLFAMGERGRFEQPVGIAVNDALNRVYIVDTKKHKIMVFDSRDGKFLQEIGDRGIEDGKFNWPTNLVLDKEGKLYVMDTFNFRVQILDPDGKFISKFGSIGSGLGQFAKPKGIGIDSEGHVYVTDAAFNNVQVFDAQGLLLMFFAGFGNKPGDLWLPAGLAVDQDDQIYVADQYNHRVNVYQYLSEKYKARQAAKK